jgi:hypothetical protein
MTARFAKHKCTNAQKPSSQHSEFQRACVYIYTHTRTHMCVRVRVIIVSGELFLSFCLCL